MNGTRHPVFKIILRFIIIILGFFLIANGIVFMVQARLGVSPWDVFHIGISRHTGLSLGRVIQFVGLAILALSAFLGIRPRLGTLLNMFFIGFFVDTVTKFGYIHAPVLLWQRVALYLGGVALVGLGAASYISANLGAGPRDSLMLALTKYTARRIVVVRTSMEAAVAILGFLLGGPLGVGTLLFAMFVGPFLEAGFAFIALVKRSSLYRNLLYGKHPLKEVS